VEIKNLGAELQMGQRELLFDVRFRPWIAGDPTELPTQSMQTSVDFVDFLMVVRVNLPNDDEDTPAFYDSAAASTLPVPSPEILWRNQNGRLQLAYSINKFPSVMAMATSVQRMNWAMS